MDNELWIRMKPKDVAEEPDDLTGFPMLEDQDFSHTEDQLDDDSSEYWCVIDLGIRGDTTLAQELWLDENQRVVEYTIR